MSTNSEQREIEVSHPQEIDVAGIERELKNLWHEEPEDQRTENSEPAVTRARVLNLLVYENNEKQAQALDDLLSDVSVAHPARILLMLADEQSPNSSIQAWVSARCRMPGPTGKQICCEQVTFQARGGLVSDLPSAVLPLLAPDLPVCLWWRAAPDLDNTVFKHLIDSSDRVIIDSAKSIHPRKDLIELAGIMHDHPHWTVFSDFNWARLTPWRGILASFYDVQDYRPYLDRVDRLLIEYSPQSNDSDNVPTRVVLLAGWLASALGWQLAADTVAQNHSNSEFTFETSHQRVQVSFKAVDRNDMDGHLASVMLGVSADQTASFIVASTPDGKRLTSEIKLGDTVQASRVLNYRPLSEEELLTGELSILGRDRPYQEAVKVAAQLGIARKG